MKSWSFLQPYPGSRCWPPVEASHLLKVDYASDGRVNYEFTGHLFRETREIHGTHPVSPLFLRLLFVADCKNGSLVIFPERSIHWYQVQYQDLLRIVPVNSRGDANKVVNHFHNELTTELAEDGKLVLEGRSTLERVPLKLKDQIMTQSHSAQRHVVVRGSESVWTSDNWMASSHDESSQWRSRQRQRVTPWPPAKAGKVEVFDNAGFA